MSGFYHEVLPGGRIEVIMALEGPEYITAAADRPPVKWRRVVLCVTVLLVLWAALAAWQRHEYGHECQSAQEMGHRQAEAVMNALVGGVRSHRRLGRFFPEQLQVALDELANSKDVLAVGVVSDDGRLALAAGQKELLSLSARMEVGRSRDDTGLRYVAEFHLEPDPAGPWEPGGGRGSGRGWGRGLRRPGDPADAESQSPLAAGGRVVAALLLDRHPVDRIRHRAFWLRVWVVVAGGLVLALLGVAWAITVRLVQARAHATLLETETKHLRELGQAAAGLAHETRNPLGLIRGWAQRLADSDLPGEEQRRQVGSVVEECDRVAARINQFRAFARPCQPRPESVPIESLIDERAVLLVPDLEAKQLTLRRSVSHPGHRVRADRELLRQSLFNLIQNAIHFSPEQGAVEITVRLGADGDCRIEVADRGPGVPADQAGLLFTPYFTTRPRGTGLGLAIVRRIAAAHGWGVGYAPRAGGGAVFWLDRIHGD